MNFLTFPVYLKIKCILHTPVFSSRAVFSSLVNFFFTGYLIYPDTSCQEYFMATCYWVSLVSPMVTLSRTQADAFDTTLCSASLRTLSVWCASRGHVSENSKSVRKGWADKGQLCQLFPRTLRGNCELGPPFNQTRAKSSGRQGWRIPCGDPFCRLPRVSNQGVPA